LGTSVAPEDDNTVAALRGIDGYEETSTMKSTPVHVACIATFAAALLVSTSGCAVGTAPDGQEGREAVSSTGQALTPGGGGSVGTTGYTCSPAPDGTTTCTCSKLIENDCEDMSAVCAPDEIDTLLKCIQGWFTNACVCRAGRVAPPTTHVTIVRSLSGSAAVSAP